MLGRRAIEYRNRILGLLFLLLALLVIVSLVTYSADDYPNSSLEPNAVLNAGGRVGAVLGSVLFLVFGYHAYGIPVLLILYGWNRLRNGRVWVLLYSVSIGISVMAAGVTTASLVEAFPAEQRFQFGGAVGLRLAQLMMEYVGPTLALPISAAVLVLLVFLLVGLSLRRRVSSQRTTRSLAGQDGQDEGGLPPPESPYHAAASPPAQFSGQ